MAAWDNAREAELRRQWGEGVRASVIAASLGMTRNAVIGKAHRLGLESRKDAAGFKPKGPPAPRRAGGRAAQRPKVKAPPARQRSVPKPPTDAAGVYSAAPLSCEPVSLLDLTEDHCRAVLGDTGRDGLAMFCGGPRAFGSYCTAHAARFYNGVVAEEIAA